MLKQTSHTLSFENLGTHWYISLYDNVSEDQKEILSQTIQTYLGAFERTYSRFRNDSIVAQLSNEWVVENPSQELIDMLTFVVDIEEKSEWYFSILLADTLTSSWYGRHIWDQKLLDVVPLKNILTISSTKITLTPWYSLDFWWFGKWRAVDAIAQIVLNSWIWYATINWGGDIRVLWEQTLVLEDPMDHTKSIWEIQITQWWVAASSPNRRKRTHEWKSYHHLINPHTKQSVQSPLMAVHTYAKNTLLADVASTILFVCPLEKIESIAQKLWVEYFLVFDDYSTVRSKWYPWGKEIGDRS